MKPQNDERAEALLRLDLSPTASAVQEIDLYLVAKFVVDASERRLDGLFSFETRTVQEGECAVQYMAIHPGGGRRIVKEWLPRMSLRTRQVRPSAEMVERVAACGAIEADLRRSFYLKIAPYLSQGDLKYFMNLAQSKPTRHRGWKEFRAALHLQEIAPAVAIATLRHSHDAMTRAAAAGRLNKRYCNLEPGFVFRELVVRIADDPCVRAEVMSSLKSYGVRAIPTLEALLFDGNKFVREEALDLIVSVLRQMKWDANINGPAKKMVDAGFWGQAVELLLESRAPGGYIMKELAGLLHRHRGPEQRRALDALMRLAASEAQRGTDLSFVLKKMERAGFAKEALELAILWRLCFIPKDSVALPRIRREKMQHNCVPRKNAQLIARSFF
jgi:hypothetical protein